MKRVVFILLSALLLIAALGLGVVGVVQHEYHKSQAATYAHAIKCNSLALDSTAYSNLPIKDKQLLIAPETVAKKLKNLHKGMTQDQVLQVLGKPTFTQAGMDNLGAGYWGCDWGYVLKLGGDGETFLDHLEVRFDKNDALKEWERVDEYGEPIK